MSDDEKERLIKRLRDAAVAVGKHDRHQGLFEDAAVALVSARPSQVALVEWSQQVRLTIRGIDGQAKRRTHRSHFAGETEEIIDGYELNTGLWHRLLGLLASCPAPEGALRSTPAPKEPT